MYDYNWVCMGLYGYVWVSLGMNNYVWVWMDMNGYLWVSMGIFGVQLHSSIAQIVHVSPHDHWYCKSMINSMMFLSIFN